jgi:class 3 adenylate cyclase/tetratricopeptide (TPR) repeat protein
LEGSVVFVDISGFTRMSERLARFGRAGAETVTAVIGSCFNRLLTEAYAYGATLLKFGGDALLLLFQGDCHARRACAAAIQMRRALREVGVVDTEAGRLTLRMTVGVHSGRYDAFLVGGAHRELVLAGAGFAEVVRVEAAASAGRIVVAPSTATWLPATSLGPAVEPGRLLRGGPLVEGRDEVRFRPAHQDMRPFVPVALRTVLGEGRDPSEHRRATVAFVEILAVAETIAEHGIAATAALLDEQIRILQAAVDRHGVCFLSSDIAEEGVKIILTAGVPDSDGADEERMLLAVHAFGEARPPLPVRVGVNSGHVFAGEIGTIHRRCFTVMGDAVNLGARLMARAGADEVIATSPVLAGSRTLFDTEELPPFFVKGKHQPITAFTVGAPRGVRTTIAPSEVPLLGRTSELATVVEAAERLSTGEGRVVELVGPTGSGKSTVLDEAVRRLRPIDVRRVQCRQYQSATPHFAIRELLTDVVGLDDVRGEEATDVLRRTVAAAAPALLPWLSLLGVTVGLTIDDSPEAAMLEEQFRRRQLEAAVVELLGALLDEPVVISFEDVQWLDEASRDVVRAMAAAAAEHPWLLVVTRRQDDELFDAGEPVTVVELGQLPADLTALLVEAAAGEPLPRHVVHAIAQRSEGNPLFALELVNALRDGGELDALPRSVEGLISARIDRLVPEDRSVLRRMSVLGSGFATEHLGALGDESVTDQSLRRLGEFLEVEPGGWVRFRHALVRDVAYAGLPFVTRQRLHGRVADSILRETGDVVERAALLSLHFFHARRFAESWQFSRLAGDTARGVYANLEAVTLYERALLSGRHLPDLDVHERADVQEALGDVQDLAGLWAAARTSYRAAAHLAEDELVRLARLALKDAFVVERRGRYVQAVRSVRRGLRLLDGRVDEEQDAARVRAQLTVWYAAIRATQGRTAEAADWSRTGIKLAEAAGDDSARARAYLILDYAESALGLAGGAENTAVALDIYTGLGDLAGQAIASNNLGAHAYYSGRWAEAIALYERSRAVRLRSGDPTNAAMADANIAEILLGQGHLEEALRLLDDAMGAWRAAGDEWGVAYVLQLRGAAAAQAGRHDDADELLLQARTRYVEIGAMADMAVTDVRIAENLVLSGRGHEALAALTTLAEQGGAPDNLVPTVHLVRGLALLLTGADGRDELELAVATSRDQQSLHQLAVALDALADLTGDADASAEAARIFADLGVVDRPAWPVG